MNPSKPPTNELAHAVVSEAVGASPAKPLPKHVVVTGNVVACERCHRMLALSKRANTREDDLRAFGLLHGHGS